MSGWDDYDLTGDERENVSEIAIEMAAMFAEEGDVTEAAEIAGDLGVEAIELGSGDLVTLDELNTTAWQRDAVRRRQDALPASRLAEDRIAQAIGRAAAHTYVPEPRFRAPGGLDFSSPSWDQRQPDVMASITGAWPCGHVDETGRCGARYHDPQCGSTFSESTVQALTESGAIGLAAGMDAETLLGDDYDLAPFDAGQVVRARMGLEDLPAPVPSQRHPDVSALRARLGLS